MALVAAAVISLYGPLPSIAAVQVCAFESCLYSPFMSHTETLREIIACTRVLAIFSLGKIIFLLQTVPPQEATSLAKSLQQQPVNKGKIWLIFLAGATGLFGAAVAIEKNSALFPAIAKANQAMAATKAAQKVYRSFQASLAFLEMIFGQLRTQQTRRFCIVQRMRTNREK